uniref:Uncharacterized protein n=1 Tax=Anguilla anguilla TaxID=7936 RepID=A0A0E9RKF2_ANGAN
MSITKLHLHFEFFKHSAFRRSWQPLKFSKSFCLLLSVGNEQW